MPRSPLLAAWITIASVTHVLLAFVILVLKTHAAEDSKAEQNYQRAISAYTAGNILDAKNLLNEAIGQDTHYAPAYMARGFILQYERKYREAVHDFSKVIEMEPRRAEAWFRRGVEHFNLGQFKRSVEDFETFAELEPGQRPHLWQLGIAYYYTGQFQQGRELFESHQTVNSHDVENAVWHFLCVAKLDGFEAARASFIDLKGDKRVPMMQVHALFKGTGTEDDVLKAAHEGSAVGGALMRYSFYAHLYLGLYHEAKANTDQAYDYMRKAAQHYKSNGYMGHVARVHRDWLKGKRQERSEDQ